MTSYNRTIQLGNITRDIELRYTQSGTAVCELSIAVNERVKKQGEWVEETSFFDWTLWGRTAEIAQEYLGKGSAVLLEGRAKQDRWEQDGQNRTKVKFVCDRMQMVGKKDSSTSTERSGTKGEVPGVSASQQRRAAAAREQLGYDNDSIPF